MSVSFAIVKPKSLTTSFTATTSINSIQEQHITRPGDATRPHNGDHGERAALLWEGGKGR